MDFDREWTVFAIQAEENALGVGRIVRAHNALREEARRLREENERLAKRVAELETAVAVRLGECDDMPDGRCGQCWTTWREDCSRCHARKCS